MIERPLYLNKLKRYKDKDLIKVITGIRRCGKSVLLFSLFYDYLVNSGVDAERIIRVDLEDNYSQHLRNAEDLYKHVISFKKDDGPHYVMIDEIQYVDQFEDLLNSLKNNNFDVYITGSNAKMLSSDIATALRGRSIEIKVYTLSFAEYYNHLCVSDTNVDVRQAFNEYVRYGGFPFIADETDSSVKTEYLKMLEDTVATKDIIERYALRNPAVFNAVYDFLCSNIGSPVSAKKIANTLRSNGYTSVTSHTVGNYLEYLCESFLFYKAYRFDIKGKEYLKTLNKYYISDIGLRNAHMNYRQLEITHTLENIIYLELVRRGYTVDIGKNREKEIDFVAKSADDTFYVQVAYTIADSEKYEQEISSFYGLDDGYKKIVVVMDSDPFTHLDNGYKKINAIDFLLNERALEEA